MDIRQLTNRNVVVILTQLAIVSLTISAMAHIQSNEVNWWQWLDGAFQNFSTEVIGAILTFILIEVLVGKRDSRENLFELVRTGDKLTVLSSLKRLKEKKITMKDSDLIGANLQGVNLSEENLMNALLREVNLQDANLVSANLQKTNLIRANLINANLKRSGLMGANLLKANLKGANLESTDLRDANLDEANLEGAKLVYSSLTGAKLRGASLQNANLQYANLTRALLEETEFNEKTILPDGTYWSVHVELERFTNPKHSEFRNTQKKIAELRKTNEMH